MCALAISNKCKVISCLTVVYSTQHYVKCICHIQKSSSSFSEDFITSRTRQQKDSKWLATNWRSVCVSRLHCSHLPPCGSGMQLIKMLIIHLSQCKCGFLAGYFSQGLLITLRCFLVLALKCSGVTHFKLQGLAHLFQVSFKEEKKSWNISCCVYPGYQLLLVGEIK